MLRIKLLTTDNQGNKYLSEHENKTLDGAQWTTSTAYKLKTQSSEQKNDNDDDIKYASNTKYSNAINLERITKIWHMNMDI